MSVPFLLQPLEAWSSPEHLFQTFRAPDASSLRAALVCMGSLTRHLEAQSGQTVHIRLENQTHLSAWKEDAILWDTQHTLPPESDVLSRNAWLVLAHQERVFAHSQVALTHVSREAREAIERGQEPLGSLFLAHEGPVDRSSLELTLASIPELARRLDQEMDTRYWCRRSLFHVNHGIRARILEIFLPPLLP